MTTRPRELGNNAKEAIASAAEEVNDAARIDQQLIESAHTLSQQDVQNRHMAIQIKLQRALRWLESIGAPTKP